MRKQMKQFHFILSLLSIFLYNVSYAQFDIPKKPKNTTEQTSVFDYANILEGSQKKQLEQKLINYADSTSNQVVVIIIPSSKGENLGILTPKWAHEWGIGDKDKDNGVLVLLAYYERQIWISPGYGLEDRLTAGLVGEITRNSIIPYFKQGNYYRGLESGTDAIIQALEGKYVNDKKPTSEVGDGIGIGTIIVIALILLFLFTRKNGGGGSGNGGSNSGSDLFDMITLGRAGSILGGGGFGSGGGFSGGGGFGGGFGGGGFSGGGAGGSW